MYIKQKPKALTRQLYANIINIAWPSSLESILVGLIGVIDTMFVGTISTLAIAAVGITNQPRLLLMAVFAAISVATTAIVARRKGEGNSKGICSVMQQSIIISFLLAIIIGIVAVVLANPILSIAGADNSIMYVSSQYFRVMMIAMPFQAVGIAINSGLRAIGKTKATLISNLTANIINIILDYALIGGNLGAPKLGVLGAAIASVIGIISGVVVSVFFIMRKNSEINVRTYVGWAFNKDILKSMWKVGSNSLFEDISIRLGYFMYAKIVASLGLVSFSTHQICNSIIAITANIASGPGTAATAMVGQTLGSKKYKLTKLYGKYCKNIALVLSVIIFATYFINRKYIISLFTDDVAVLELGSQIMIIIAIVAIIQSQQIVTYGILRGAGDTRYTAVISLISMAIVRPLSAFLLCNVMDLGLIGAWYSLFLDQSCRYVLGTLRLKKDKWLKIEL